MHAKGVWLRVVGLLFYLWCWEVLKKNGDCHGGFVAVDVEISRLHHLLWARVLVR